MGLILLPPQDWEELEQVVAALQTWIGKQEGVNTALETQTGSIAAVPTGAILPWSTSTAPTGYLLCNGQIVSRTTYAKLFSVIGGTYGAGDGSTTFAVPDLRGRFPLGVAASGTGSTLAGTGGALDHTHSISGSTAAGGDHNHGGATGSTPHNSRQIDANLDGVQATLWDGDPLNYSLSISSSGTHTHDGGSLAAAAANPAFLAVHYIIRT